MARLARPVMKMRSVMPADTASSTAYWMRGLSTMGSISFGDALVAGRKRVPRPATGNMAFVIFIFVQESEELLFIEHRHAELPCLVELGAGFLAGHDVIGLRRHRAGDLAAARLNAFARFVAGHCGQRPGEDDNLTREGAFDRPMPRLFLPTHARRAQLFDHFAIVAFAKESGDRFGDHGPDVGRLL